MKTLLKSLAVVAVLTAGVAAVAPAAQAQPLVVVNEGHGYHHGYDHRGPGYGRRDWHRGGYGRHCNTRVFYRHGYRHVVRHCW